MVGGGSKSAKGGPNPLADMDRGGSKSASGFGPGGPNPRGVQIRCDTGLRDFGKRGKFRSDNSLCMKMFSF